MEAAGGLAGILSLVLVVAREIFNAVNHRRLRSNCCGKEAVISVDVEATTPPEQRKSAQQPVPPIQIPPAAPAT
jgi:hypothetical protein